VRMVGAKAIDHAAGTAITWRSALNNAGDEEELIDMMKIIAALLHRRVYSRLVSGGKDMERRRRREGRRVRS